MPTKQNFGTSIEVLFKTSDERPSVSFLYESPSQWSPSLWRLLVCNGEMYKIHFSVCYRSNDSRVKVDAVDKT